MKKITIILLFCASILIVCFAGCVKWTETLSADECDAAAQCLLDMEFSGDDIGYSVLFNKNGDPVYVLAASENGYVIVKRGSTKILEAGELNPYKDNMELKKYYGEVFTHVVYDPSNPDAPFRCLKNDTYGATYEEAVKGK